MARKYNNWAVGGVILQVDTKYARKTLDTFVDIKVALEKKIEICDKIMENLRKFWWLAPSSIAFFENYRLLRRELQTALNKCEGYIYNLELVISSYEASEQRSFQVVADLADGNVFNI